MTRYLTLLFFVTVLAVGTVTTWLVFDSERKAAQAAFDISADEFVHRTESRLKQHIALITATGAFIEASGPELSRRSFNTFARGLRLETDFAGIRGIGFAALLSSKDPRDDAKVRNLLLRHYGLERDVWPLTEQLRRAVILLLEPLDGRNEVALGYDMFEEPRRRSAMERALASGQVQASAPVELVQEITLEKQLGFLIYYPVNRMLASPTQQATADQLAIPGFAYAPFRAGDFFSDILRTFPEEFIEVSVTDTTDGLEQPLFQTANLAPSHFESTTMTRHVIAAGREWTLRLHPGASYVTARYVYTLGIGAALLLLAIAAALAMRWQQRAMEAVEALNEISQRTINEKDLMLQEMKHRIKNSIARILAMARQTAAHSDSLDAFKTSFFARLQAMANAQEMLTRSHWQRAELRELLTTELKQVFGEGQSQARLQGPDVELNESATQALGLTFHELATNALKYGDYESGASTLEIAWRREIRDGQPHLVLDWCETTGVDMEKVNKAGFGTRLIDASIRLELGGAIEREVDPTRLAIRIVFPLRD